MGEYASLTIWRKLEDNKPQYQEYYKIFNNPETRKQFWENLGEEALNFGSLIFRIIENNVYYSHVPVDLFEAEKHRKVCKFNIKKEWLTCFTYDEMKVIGDNMGVFIAKTTAEKAKQRIDTLDLKDNTDWIRRRYDLYCWLGVNTEPQDILILSSEAIYYSMDGEFNDEFVKHAINREVKIINKDICVPHWKKINTNQ